MTKSCLTYKFGEMVKPSLGFAKFHSGNTACNGIWRTPFCHLPTEKEKALV